MHWNLFHYQNTLEMIFTYKFTGNYITIKMIENVFTIKMLWKRYHFKNALGTFSLYEYIGNDFVLKFALEIFLL